MTMLVTPRQELMQLVPASQKGHTEILKALLAVGADEDAATEWGATPLHIASQQGQTECVAALLAAGASRNIAACVAVSARPCGGAGL